MLEEPEQLTGDDSLEAASGFAGFAFDESAGDVDAGAGVGAAAGHDDGVQGAVELAVATRLRRWRSVNRDDAGMGAAPARVANAASERSLPGCDQLIRT